LTLMLWTGEEDTAGEPWEESFCVQSVPARRARVDETNTYL